MKIDPWIKGLSQKYEVDEETVVGIFSLLLWANMTPKIEKELEHQLREHKRLSMIWSNGR